ncbi:hypothetical protein GOBAR_AA20673 [Gossypium barbadense]|uniref:Uncharacterized protein n=1 Tax=Gossypium barbadense TaxID=3634 RepID=A0A2P5X9J8_GOSBA|nr:hypothetical protein GOBAR_AA20673 [Gossypium barbadense]
MKMKGECAVDLGKNIGRNLEQRRRKQAFSRIAPAVPIIANVIISENLFEVLTISTGGWLHFSVNNKYLNGLERIDFKIRTIELDKKRIKLQILLGKRGFVQ